MRLELSQIEIQVSYLHCNQRLFLLLNLLQGRVLSNREILKFNLRKTILCVCNWVICLSLFLKLFPFQKGRQSPTGPLLCYLIFLHLQVLHFFVIFHERCFRTRYRVPGTPTGPLLWYLIYSGI